MDIWKDTRRGSKLVASLKLDEASGVYAIFASEDRGHEVYINKAELKDALDLIKERNHETN